MRATGVFMVGIGMLSMLSPYLPHFFAPDVSHFWGPLLKNPGEETVTGYEGAMLWLIFVTVTFRLSLLPVGREGGTHYVSFS